MSKKTLLFGHFHPWIPYMSKHHPPLEFTKRTHGAQTKSAPHRFLYGAPVLISFVSIYSFPVFLLASTTTKITSTIAATTITTGSAVDITSGV